MEEIFKIAVILEEKGKQLVSLIKLGKWNTVFAYWA